MARSFVRSLELDTDVVLYICAIGAYFVGCLTLVGIDAVLKLYYIKKLESQGVEWDH